MWSQCALPQIRSFLPAPCGAELRQVVMMLPSGQHPGLVGVRRCQARVGVYSLRMPTSVDPYRNV